MTCMQDPISQPFLKPAFDRNAIPVVFAANNGFVPYFAACLQSLLDHTSPIDCYDLVLIHTDVTEDNKARLTEMVSAYDNVSLRFFHAGHLLQNRTLKANAHISVETYFRFLIQQILPDYDKVLYLDCDVIIHADIAELYRTDVEGYLLAAARDPEFLGHLHGADRQIQKYILTKLHMKDPESYFQAGVLLFNEKEMRRAYSLEQWLSYASTPYKYNDQDVLNLYCEGRVKYLDMAWNLITDCEHTRVSRIIVHAPEHIRKEYAAAHAAPKIIHYAGYRKPWQKPTEDMAQFFWSALRKTPYYEEALYGMACFAAKECIQEDRRGRSPYWKLRRMVKKLLTKKQGEEHAV